MKTFLSATVIAFGALVLNPMLACQSEDNVSDSDSNEYEFGESEMLLAVTGTYEGTVGADAKKVTVVLEQATVEGSSSTQNYRRTQCGDRSFVKPAAACISTTSMPLLLKITSESPAIAGATLHGKATIVGRLLGFGDLSTDAGTGPSLRAKYDENAHSFVQWVYDAGDGSESTPLSLSRK